MRPIKLAHFSPGKILLLSLFSTILCGTFLLAFPISRTQPIAFIDLFFTATSATCVTGLFTIPLDSFTTFGHCIILILIQIGGIGLITLGLFLMSIFIRFGMATQLMAGQLLEIEQWKNIKRIIIFIILATISIEFIGMLLLIPIFHAKFSLPEACFFSLFHAISSFCNAGISLFNTNMQQYAHNYGMLFITTLLIFMGGLGFIVWEEIIRYGIAIKQKKRYSFSLHSKIILYGTTILIATVALLLLFLEYKTLFSSDNFFSAPLRALFYAVSFRSTGFLTINLGTLQVATFLLIMIVTFIGSSPGSTGSGIKITSLVIFLATIKAAISGQLSVNIKGRRIPKDLVLKSTTIIALSVFWILGTTFLLLILEKEHAFLAIIFETISAFSNLGLSTGITSLLTTSSKVLIIASMIAGRVGSLTLLLAIRKIALRQQTGTTKFIYPEERVMLS